MRAMAKQKPIDIKVAVAYSVIVEGKTARAVASEHRVARASVARWAEDSTIRALVDARRREEASPVPSPAQLREAKPEWVAPPVPDLPPVQTDCPIDEVTRRRLLELLRTKLVPVPLALQAVRLSPRAYAQWVSRMERDEGVAELVLDIRQAQAAGVIDIMGDVLAGRGRGAIWAMSKALPQYYRDDVPPEDEAKARDPGESLGRIMGKFRAA